jgi:hypothetical protein
MHFNLVYKMFWEKLIAFWHNLKLSFGPINCVFNELFNETCLEMKVEFGSISCNVSEKEKLKVMLNSRCNRFIEKLCSSIYLR